MHLILITNCTRKKKQVYDEDPLVVPSDVNSVEEILDVCIGSKKTQLKLHAAEELYTGRGALLAKKLQKITHSELYFISAGLGLVSQNTLCPSYDISISPANSTLAVELKRLKVSHQDWWLQVNQNQEPIHKTLMNSHEKEMWISASLPYIKMIGNDLKKIPNELLKNLRIFTSPAGQEALEHRLKTCVMPYDQRLNQVFGYAGVSSDFSQRAMQHFADKIWSKDTDLLEQSSSVRQVMEACEPPLNIKNRRLTNEQITDEIRLAWSAYGGQSGKLLRHFRDDLKIACEQKRFQTLYRQMLKSIGSVDI